MLRSILICLCTVYLIGPFNARAIEVNQIHRENDITCKNCHEIDEPEKRASDQACIDCHSAVPGSVKTYADRGMELLVNIHDSHEGQLRCTLCHHIHEPSDLYCNSCHELEIITP
ncbi:cytochrome c3 family protein [Desulfofustis glycolicus]|uniref:Cytochrome c3 n=1 Tax=Desulfofustis glycolicus DSM 9705 TaxID=1121409 RepID=A0A1M5YBW8_9BACT|nr:cytochrome c3 family protein [Desulfobulbaceae bacterium]SHI09581.1 Cytochrome c3 [Desulfofustis glycolicus DSM 9705]